MRGNELASVAIAVIVLAGISRAIAGGGDTAKVMSSAFDGFSNVIKAATYGK